MGTSTLQKKLKFRVELLQRGRAVFGDLPAYAWLGLTFNLPCKSFGLLHGYDSDSRPRMGQ